MAALDWVVITIYFAVVFGIAIWAYLQERGDESAAGYFLGGRNVGWFVVGASLFVSNIGSEHLVGLSGTGADRGSRSPSSRSSRRSSCWRSAGSSCRSTCAAACSRCRSSWSAGTRPRRAST